jgi:hypothetical protein
MLELAELPNYNHMIAQEGSGFQRSVRDIEMNNSGKPAPDA